LVHYKTGSLKRAGSKENQVQAGRSVRNPRESGGKVEMRGSCTGRGSKNLCKTRKTSFFFGGLRAKARAQIGIERKGGEKKGLNGERKSHATWWGGGGGRGECPVKDQKNKE